MIEPHLWSVCNIVVALVALMVIYKIYCLFLSGVIRWLGFSVFGLFLLLLWCFAYKTINSTIIHYSFKEERVCSYIIRSIFFSSCSSCKFFFATNLHVVFCVRFHVLVYRLYIAQATKSTPSSVIVFSIVRSFFFIFGFWFLAAYIWCVRCGGNLCCVWHSCDTPHKCVGFFFLYGRFIYKKRIYSFI